MILAEAGYEKTLHDAGLDTIRKPRLTISEAIESLVVLYQELYNVDAWHVNCGMCEDFAHDAVNLIPEAIAEWGDGFTNEEDDSNQYSYHCIVLYKNKFYDSQHPNGVADFRMISAFRS